MQSRFKPDFGCATTLSAKSDDTLLSVDLGPNATLVLIDFDTISHE